jgi:hypothetical protein
MPNTIVIRAKNNIWKVQPSLRAIQRDSIRQLSLDPRSRQGQLEEKLEYYRIKYGCTGGQDKNLINFCSPEKMEGAGGINESCDLERQQIQQ